MADKDQNEEKDDEYIISEPSVESAVNSALSQFSEGEIVKNEKKPNFYTLMMFKKNIGGAILGKEDKRKIEGKYLQNTEENIKKITNLILDSARKYEPDKEPEQVLIIVPDDKDKNKANGDAGKTDPGDGQQQVQGEATKPSQESKNKKKRLFIPIAAAALIGGTIGTAITSGANIIINEHNNISIEYDLTENKIDALADLEQSSNDLIDENRNIADLIKGTNSDIREESALLDRPFSEDERVESESSPINYLDEVEKIQTQRDNAIAKYALIKEPTDADKLEYTLQQLDVQSKLLNFKNEKLQVLLERKDAQSKLIQEHSEAGYSKESHSKELKGNEALVQIYKERLQKVPNDIAKNDQMLTHFKNLDLSQVQDFDEYFNAYFAGLQNTDVDKLDEFEQAFNNYNGYVKSYKVDFKAEDFQKYIAAYTDGMEQGQSIDKINKQFDKEINLNKFFNFFRE